MDLPKPQEHSSDCWASMKEKPTASVGNTATFHRVNLAILDLVTNLVTFRKHQIEPRVRSLVHLESFH